MPVRVEKFFVALCPTCGQKQDFSGDSAFTVYATRAELREAIELDEALDGTLDQRIAENCSDGCSSVYQHRNCHKRPCGYCEGKGSTKWREEKRKAILRAKKSLEML